VTHNVLPAGKAIHIPPGLVVSDRSVPSVSGPCVSEPNVSGCHSSKPQRVRHECGDMPFLVQRDGTWLYRGSPIGRKELVCLFSSVLTRDAAGDYVLETPVERGRIQVEDTPWIAVEMDWKCSGSGQNQSLSFRTNVDQVVTAGPDHPLRVSHNALTCEPVPYIHILAGQGSHPLEARISRPVYYELVAIAVPGCVGGQQKLGVWSCGMFFPLGDLGPSPEA